MSHNVAIKMGKLYRVKGEPGDSKQMSFGPMPGEIILPFDWSYGDKALTDMTWNNIGPGPETEFYVFVLRTKPQTNETEELTILVTNSKWQEMYELVEK